MTENPTVGKCGVCGSIASVAIRCACGWKLAYCASCSQVAGQLMKLHAGECDSAERSSRPTPRALLAWWRQLEDAARSAPTSEPVVSLTVPEVRP